ncbi:hypothetical protein LZ30DRAFT_179103 [Colletotrichum cereale]|nr:hypothetical protein LZ30DRAFT_179103 [Colletotrichum cereale]
MASVSVDQQCLQPYPSCVHTIRRSSSHCTFGIRSSSLLTHSLTYPLTHPLTHSPTHSLTHSLTRSLAHSHITLGTPRRQTRNQSASAQLQDTVDPASPRPRPRPQRLGKGELRIPGPELDISPSRLLLPSNKLHPFLHGGPSSCSNLSLPLPLPLPSIFQKRDHEARAPIPFLFHMRACRHPSIHLPTPRLRPSSAPNTND